MTFSYSILKDKTFTIKISEQAVDVALLLRICPPQEKKIIQSLIVEEKSFRLKENRIDQHKPFASFRIRKTRSYTLLQELAATGKLFFEKKKLACDFFTPLKLKFVVDEKEKAISVTLVFKDPNREYSLSECDLIIPGAKHIVLTGIILRFLHEDIAFQDIQPFIEAKTPLLMSLAEFKNLQKEFQGNSQIQFVFLKEPELHADSQEVFPVLFLKDQLGAFADLAMEYNGKIVPLYTQSTKAEKEIIRNEKAEAIFEKDLLESGFERRHMPNSNYFCKLDKLHETLDFLLDVGFKIFDYKERRVKRLTELKLEMIERDDMITIEGSSSFDDAKVSVYDLISALQKKESFFQLPDNSVGHLFKKSKELKNLTEFAHEIVLSGKAQIKKNRLGLFQATLTGSFSHTNNSLEDLSLFRGKLYPYQQEGVEWLTNLYTHNFHGILADDMGLGKTIQTIALLSKFPRNSSTLIVVPTSLLFNWKRELEEFLPSAKLLVYHGFRSHNELSENSYRVILTSYGILRQDIEHLEKIDFTAVILDEAQNIKNQKSLLHQAACRLKTNFRLSLTGTPIENSLEELCAQFQFLMPDLIDQSLDLEIENLSKLKKKVAPFILRRKKEEVLQDLPEKVEQYVFVEMADVQRRLYDETLENFKNGLLKKASDTGQNNTMEILEAILRLRQICAHPQLIPELLQTGKCPSQKFELVLDDIQTILAEKKKVIVFSQFTSMLKLFCEECKNLQIPYLLLDGKTKNRKEIVDRFQQDDHEALLFMSLKAGGVGLNLTKADYVLLYDPWWNEAQEEQAISRAHRIGRKDTVFSKRYVMKDTIEENILKLKSSKKELSDFFLEDTNPIGNLTIADLELLLH